VAVFGVPTEFWLPVLTFAVGVAGDRLTRRFSRGDEKADKVQELLTRYRDPLLGAAFDLQSRLYNIVERDFLSEYYSRDDADPLSAENTTLWMIGQYFGWVEILRREVQFLDLGRVSDNRELQGRLDDVNRAFASDDITVDDRPSRLMIFKAHQRAIGEAMVREPAGEAVTDRAYCLGITEFARLRHDDAFWQWFRPLADDLEPMAENPSEQPRLVAVQRALVDLIDVLDPHYERYPNPQRRGRLLPRSADAPGRHKLRVDSFEVLEIDDSGVFAEFDRWAAERGIAHGEEAGDRRVRTRIGPFGSRLEVWAWCDGRRMAIDAHVMPPGWTERFRSSRRIPLAPGRGRLRFARWRGRSLVSDLVTRYGSKLEL
jgi:hypothetical protein